MESITSTAALKNAIEVLEVEHALQGQAVKEQFYIVYESLKPINMIKRTLRDLTSAEYLVENIPGALIGMASGYLSRKIVTGRSGNIFRKLLGSILQFGVTNVVAKNSETIQSTGLSIFQHFLQKKIMNSKNSVR